jgi:ribosomal protein S18 acetylase RimI-like enzyme
LIAIQAITPQNAIVYKAVRLRALRDSPSAFSSTYANESQLTDSEWLARAERMSGESGAGFLAMEGEHACGIVGSFLDPNDPASAHLVSMWTAPSHRRQGVGRLLVQEVLTWAHGRKARRLLLMVTSNNQSAIHFYERLEFTRTGRTEPFPNELAVIEYEMSRRIP